MLTGSSPSPCSSRPPTLRSGTPTSGRHTIYRKSNSRRHTDRSAHHLRMDHRHSPDANSPPKAQASRLDQRHSDHTHQSNQKHSDPSQGSRNASRTPTAYERYLTGGSHFLNRIRIAVEQAKKHRATRLPTETRHDLEFWILLLDGAAVGIDLNLLVTRAPDRMLRTDA